MAAQSSSSSPSSSSSSTPSSTSIYPSSSSALTSQRYSCPTNSTEQQLNHLNQLNLNATMDALDLIQAQQRLIADNQSLNTPNVGNNLLSATATSSIQNSTNSTSGGLIQQLTAINHHNGGNNAVSNQDPLQSIVQQLFLHYNGSYLTQRGHL